MWQTEEWYSVPSMNTLCTQCLKLLNLCKIHIKNTAKLKPQTKKELCTRDNFIVPVQMIHLKLGNTKHQLSDRSAGPLHHNDMFSREFECQEADTRI